MTQAIYISNTIGPNLIGTANAEVIIMRRWHEEEINKPIFSQRCLKTFFIFLSCAPRSFSSAREKKNQIVIF